MMRAEGRNLPLQAKLHLLPQADFDHLNRGIDTSPAIISTTGLAPFISLLTAFIAGGGGGGGGGGHYSRTLIHLLLQLPCVCVCVCVSIPEDFPTAEERVSIVLPQRRGTFRTDETLRVVHMSEASCLDGMQQEKRFHSVNLNCVSLKQITNKKCEFEI